MTQTKQLSAFVTGANGFLGKHLCSQLLDKGWLVYGLCRNPENANELDERVNPIIGDILAVDDFKNKLPKGLNALFHTAASTNVWNQNNHTQTRVNINGTENMLNLMQDLKIEKYIHISSVVVFGIHSKLTSIEEKMPKIGINSWINYVKTKTQSEQLVLSNKNIFSIVINPTHIIGPGDTSNWARLIKMVAEKKLPTIPNGSGSFVDVRDVANGIIESYHHGKSGNNYLLGGTNLTFKEFIVKLAHRLKVNPPKTQLPTSLLKFIANLKGLTSKFTKKEPDITPESVTLISDLYYCDSIKAKKHINFKNTKSINTTLDDTINFLKNNKIIQ